jgi:hypothetical protein
MEGLSRMIFVAVSGGLLEGFKVGNASFSHILFGDDTLIFRSARSSQLRYLWSLFFQFESASGLKANLAESKLIGCGVATLPVKYLGLPLGASYKSIHIWDCVIEKIEHRLASWKRLYISKGGRVTFIKSTLTNIPMYYLSLFPLSASVAVRIEKIQ